ncbi:DUF1761 domain-containing protein [Sulfitobacter sp. PR48]|jgi:hypothetical protein|uniref:DUF1761 domain-containing protein n=1 Tax=Sulfitobacter porphyrae TaxID=1246864 RepID=A0ABW2B7L9_9RHOB|nr:MULTISPECIES: DUF1761 domain-containing protein [unclassified Sulfitobacter]MCZ4255696.1 DUF1761 domain-containing protein [Sulfitobacter sp. G21635-S1]MDD9719534.1 DUF1761 domain-containing protein [Sulfitobacter sp. PR48]GLT08522.1 hypothetical protein GCM10007928_07540 [Sulfitobacter porphyrae]
MGYLAVIIAAAAGFGFGAVWYMLLAKPWMAAVGIKVGPNGKPEGDGSSLPFILSGVAMLLVAGMMRHVFALSGIDTAMEGLVSGLGIGLFFISPWIMINNAYPGRPFRLTLIDSGYATFGCAIIGLVLTLF